MLTHLFRTTPRPSAWFDACRAQAKTYRVNTSSLAHKCNFFFSGYQPGFSSWGAGTGPELPADSVAGGTGRCSWLEDTGKLPARFRLSPDDPFIPEMRDFCRCRQLEIPDSFSFHPINSEACLTHWRPLVQLLMGLNKSQLALFKKFKLYEERDLVDEIV